MPTTTGYSFGDIVLVPFPFTDQTAAKKRPAIVVSSDAYHRDRRDVVVMAVTSQARPGSAIGEAAVAGWKDAGLLKPSVVKPVLATVDRDLIVRKLGTLRDDDRRAVQHALSVILGG
ncbi:MAG: type II toxin-antitoxin system PemK/MazF family toxin [Proteobacteria bacterium]|nr:type II toxin-antitoxin system PemK/MazF family toxin [Pseudomonadota bacterium]